MKVFVVNHLKDPYYGKASASTVGVFATLAQALECMRDEYKGRLVDVFDFCYVESEDELTPEDDVKLCTMKRKHSIYHAGNVDEWRITEWDV